MVFRRIYTPQGLKGTHQKRTPVVCGEMRLPTRVNYATLALISYAMNGAGQLASRPSAQATLSLECSALSSALEGGIEKSPSTRKIPARRGGKKAHIVKVKDYTGLTIELEGARNSEMSARGRNLKRELRL
ncbi:hypothetical protein C8R46DRAFT_1033744 [Mycena filopes]|nr:hypothetical protein C8R46DRAFT_1033738 [Mycena filopes]KAJ7168508.1 hypothetical protein C8R46DRAFT_1033741 [Mycena filopes]KAJ7168511.1 hypothetical protein C8R46DRAFT_1033744 [Mycena filopes]